MLIVNSRLEDHKIKSVIINFREYQVLVSKISHIPIIIIIIIIIGIYKVPLPKVCPRALYK